MTTSSQFRGTGPAALNTGEYTHSFDQTKSLGAKVSAARTADQTEIALFWADGPATCTPPGHWHLIAGVVSQQKGYGLLDDARLFALLSLAQADAAISAWDMKRTYFNWRPITAIRKADTDGNPHTVKDPAWEPLIATPAFPDYVSGHSCFSEASAEILKRFTGNDQAAFSVGSDGMPGTSRSFTTFSAAADEAGLSRIYGGIHFQFSNKDAQQAGRKLAQQAFTKYLTKI
jgi:hypothetical protein